MHPWLLTSPPVASYGVCLVAAVVAAWWLARRNARRWGVDASHVDLLVPLLVAAGIAGAWGFGVWTRTLTGGNGGEGGLVLAGAMVLPTVVGILYAWRAGMPLGLLGDVFAAPGALAIAIGRIGCVMAGCCYGKVCATGLPSAWGMHFPRGSVAFSELSRLGQVDAHAIGTPALVPVQVFEIVGCLLLMAGVTFVARLVRGGRGVSGEAFLGFGATYAVLRFGLEFLRADNPPAWGGLTFSQGVMVGVFLLALGTCGIRRVWGGRWGLSALKTVAPSASSEQGVAGNSEQRGEGEGAARGVAGAHP